MIPGASVLQAAQASLDAHVRETIAWHFSPETGCPFWLDWARPAIRRGRRMTTPGAAMLPVG